MANKAESLIPFFRPKSIAIIGVSRKPRKIGHEILHNLKLSGFQGDIFSINPNTSSVLGLKTYKTISDVKREIDLAIIAIPAASVTDALEQCAKAGVKAAIIITSGFGEAGKIDLEKRLVDIASPAGMRLM